MRVFRIECDVDRFRGIDLTRDEDEAASSLKREFKSDEHSPRNGSQLPPFDWDDFGKSRAYPDIADINWTGGFCDNDRARALFQSLHPISCEILPARSTAAGEMSLVHVFSADVFPPDHYHQGTAGLVISPLR